LLQGSTAIRAHQAAILNDEQSLGNPPSGRDESNNNEQS